MKKKILKATLVIFIIIFVVSLIQSIYLSIYLTKLRIDKHNDVPYVHNSFISHELYDNLTQSVMDNGETRETLKEIKTDFYEIGFTYTLVFLNKAYYSGDYYQKFDGMTDNGEKIRFGAIASTYVDLRFENFQWKVVKVWEDP